MSDDAQLQNPEKDTSDWVTGDEPMTGPQRSYLQTARAGGQAGGARRPDQSGGLRGHRSPTEGDRPRSVAVARAPCRERSRRLFAASNRRSRVQRAIALIGKRLTRPVDEPLDVEVESSAGIGQRGHERLPLSRSADAALQRLGLQKAH